MHRSRTYNSVRHIRGGEAIHVVRKIQDSSGIECGVKQIPDVAGGRNKFVGSQQGGYETPQAVLHLAPEFSGGLHPLLVEVAAQNRGVQIENRRTHMEKLHRFFRSGEAARPRS